MRSFKIPIRKLCLILLLSGVLSLPIGLQAESVPIFQIRGRPPCTFLGAGPYGNHGEIARNGNSLTAHVEVLGQTPNRNRRCPVSFSIRPRRLASRKIRYVLTNLNENKLVFSRKVASTGRGNFSYQYFKHACATKYSLEIFLQPESGSELLWTIPLEVFCHFGT